MSCFFKFFFWALVLEVFKQFFHSNALQFYPYLVRNLDGWALGGFGFSLTLLFFLKYFVLIGFAGTLAKLDGVQFPPPPKCTSRIHEASYLWRSFDMGMYKWLSKYFYKPIIGENWNLVNKLCSTFICFSYVCLWHRMEDAIIVWCLINFLMIAGEQIVSFYYEHGFFAQKYKSLSPILQQQIYLIIQAIMFEIMVLSNVLFLSNLYIGYNIFTRFMLTFPVPFLPMLFVLYSGVIVSIHQKEKEMQVLNEKANS